MVGRSRRQPRGFALVYVSVALAVLMALGSLAVDVGRYQAARAELQAAADAIVRHAATGLADNTALAKAQSLAAESRVDLGGISVQSGDLQIGHWNASTRVFTPGGSPANALRVRLVRSAARGNAIPLVLARAVGMNSINASAEAIAVATAPPAGAPGGWVTGLQTVNMNGNARIEPFDAHSGTPVVSSNGNWNLNGNVLIDGHARYRQQMPGQQFVTRTRTQMTTPLSYPMPTLPPTYTHHGNVNLSGNSRLRLGTGNHYFQTLNVNGNAEIEIDNAAGPVRLYVDGSFNWSGNSDVLVSHPLNGVELYMVSGAGVDLSGNQRLTMAIYAPNSPLNMNGNVELRGSAIVSSINMNGNPTIHYDERLRTSAMPGGSGGGGGSSSPAGVTTVTTVR